MEILFEEEIEKACEVEKMLFSSFVNEKLDDLYHEFKSGLIDIFPDEFDCISYQLIQYPVWLECLHKFDADTILKIGFNHNKRILCPLCRYENKICFNNIIDATINNELIMRQKILNEEENFYNKINTQKIYQNSNIMINENIFISKSNKNKKYHLSCIMPSPYENISELMNAIQLIEEQTDEKNKDYILTMLINNEGDIINTIMNIKEITDSRIILES